MKITILGCGPSGGIPLIGNNWGECDPNEPRNRRTRVSVLIENAEQTILIDASPDLRQQLLNCNAQKVNAVLFTHAHADHCHGIDELRSVNWLMQKPIDIYADAMTMNELEERFRYIFHGAPSPGDFYKPVVVPHRIKGPFNIGQTRVTPFAQNHGYMQSLGFRIGDFAYSTDVKELSESAFNILTGVKIWIVDCIREPIHPTHSHLAQSLEWIKRINPKQAYLTHMNHTMDYAKLAAKLPAKVWPAYDGLVLEC